MGKKSGGKGFVFSIKDGMKVKHHERFAFLISLISLSEKNKFSSRKEESGRKCRERIYLMIHELNLLQRSRSLEVIARRPWTVLR